MLFKMLLMTLIKLSKASQQDLLENIQEWDVDNSEVVLNASHYQFAYTDKGLNTVCINPSNKSTQLSFNKQFICNSSCRIEMLLYIMSPNDVFDSQLLIDGFKKPHQNMKLGFFTNQNEFDIVLAQPSGQDPIFIYIRKDHVQLLPKNDHIDHSSMEFQGRYHYFCVSIQQNQLQLIHPIQYASFGVPISNLQQYTNISLRALNFSSQNILNLTISNLDALQPKSGLIINLSNSLNRTFTIPQGMVTSLHLQFVLDIAYLKIITESELQRKYCFSKVTISQGKYEKFSLTFLPEIIVNYRKVSCQHLNNQLPCSVNLNLSEVQQGLALLDQFFEVYDIEGTDYDDILTGNKTDNIIIGGTGSDVIFGCGGNDQLIGGTGQNLLSLRSEESACDVYLPNGNVTKENGDIYQIEGFVGLYDSLFDDNLYVLDDNNLVTIFSQYGNDNFKQLNQKTRVNLFERTGTFKCHIQNDTKTYICLDQDPLTTIKMNIENGFPMIDFGNLQAELYDYYSPSDIILSCYSKKKIYYLTSPQTFFLFYSPGTRAMYVTDNLICCGDKDYIFRHEQMDLIKSQCNELNGLPGFNGTQWDDQFKFYFVQHQFIDSGIGNDYIWDITGTSVIYYSNQNLFQVNVSLDSQIALVDKILLDGTNQVFKDTIQNVYGLQLTRQDDNVDAKTENNMKIDGHYGINTLTFLRMETGIVNLTNFMSFQIIRGSNYTDNITYLVDYPITVRVTDGNDLIAAKEQNNNTLELSDDDVPVYDVPVQGLFKLILDRVSSSLTIPSSPVQNQKFHKFNRFSFRGKIYSDTSIVHPDSYIFGFSGEGFHFIRMNFSSSSMGTVTILKKDPNQSLSLIFYKCEQSTIDLSSLRIENVKISFPLFLQNSKIILNITSDSTISIQALHGTSKSMISSTIIFKAKVDDSTLHQMLDLITFCLDRLLTIKRTPNSLVCNRICAPTCESCDYNPYNCTLCSGELYFRVLEPINNVCSCLEGYFESYEKSCKACLPLCKSCTDSNSCEACFNNRVFNKEVLVCQCEQPLLPFGDFCLRCPQSCTHCETVNGEIQCTKCLSSQLLPPLCACKEGEYQDQLNICRPMNPRCKDSIGGECLGCSFNRRNPPKCTCIDGFVEVNEDCLKCPPQCSGCTSPVSCTSCSGQLIINPPSCDQCIPGYYMDQFQCMKCPQKCHQCTNEQSAIQCLQCNDAKAVVPLCECQKGTYYNKETKQCENCGRYCLQCKDLHQCLQCSPTRELPECKCPSQTYDTKDNLCKLCPSNCIQCLDSSTCSLCPTKFFLMGLNCQPSCDDGYYEGDGFQCIQCKRPCNFCTTQTSCLSCHSGKLLNEAQCVQNCPEGLVANQEKQTCVTCHLSCLACNSEGVKGCTKCKNGTDLMDNMCLSECKSRHKECSICTEDESLCIQYLDITFTVKQHQSENYTVQLLVNSTTNLKQFPTTEYPHCLNQNQCPIYFTLTNQTLLQDYFIGVNNTSDGNVLVTFALNEYIEKIMINITINNSSKIKDLKGVKLKDNYQDNNFQLEFNVSKDFSRRIISEKLIYNIKEFTQELQATNTSTGTSFDFLSRYQFIAYFMRASQKLSLMFLMNTVYSQEEVIIFTLFLQTQCKIDVQRESLDQNRSLLASRDVYEARLQYNVTQPGWLKYCQYGLVSLLFATQLFIRIRQSIRKKRQSPMTDAGLLMIYELNQHLTFSHPLNTFIDILLHNILETYLFQVAFLFIPQFNDLTNTLDLILPFGLFLIFLYDYVFNLIILINLLHTRPFQKFFNPQRTRLFESLIPKQLGHLIDLRFNNIFNCLFHYLSTINKLLIIFLIFKKSQGAEQITGFLFLEGFETVYFLVFSPYRSFIKQSIFLFSSIIISLGLCVKLVQHEYSQNEIFRQDKVFDDMSIMIAITLLTYIVLQIFFLFWRILMIIPIIFDFGKQHVQKCINKKNYKQTQLQQICFELLYSVFILNKNITIKQVLKLSIVRPSKFIKSILNSIPPANFIYHQNIIRVTKIQFCLIHAIIHSNFGTELLQTLEVRSKQYQQTNQVSDDQRLISLKFSILQLQCRQSVNDSLKFKSHFKVVQEKLLEKVEDQNLLQLERITKDQNAMIALFGIKQPKQLTTIHLQQM